MTKLTDIVGLAIASLVLTIASTPGAYAQALRKIAIANECSRPIQMIVYSANSYHNWQPHGWYQFVANDPYSYVRTKGVILTQLEDHDLYFYAETTDGQAVLRWQDTSGASVNVEYQGGTYRMIKAKTFLNEDGDTALRVTCP
ncbi:hypothetical protein [uncultured Sphingomonas sp.]|uniref:hypothetical protein n=1 Tax=uncultured Sphingomonas sp. TaxID=158754 RepID=UPI0035CAB132